MNTEQQSTDQPNNYQHVFVDTNIFLYAGSKDHQRSEAVLQCLEEIEAMGYKLAISEYTTYESLTNQWGKKAEETIAALKRYERRKEVTNQILIIAAILRGLYHDERIDNISDGDIIIGATAILENGLVFTRNHKDFPNPFFVFDNERETHFPHF